MVLTEILLGVFILGVIAASAVGIVYTIELLSRIKIGIIVVWGLIICCFIYIAWLLGSYVLQN